MEESGRHFCIERYDLHRKSTTDSGIFCLSIQGDEEDPMMPYCGVLTDILEVEYGTFNIILMGARWYKVELEGRNRSVVRDECGFIRVDTRRTMPRSRKDSDVWVFPHQVDQCFYVPMTSTLRGWSLVVPVFPRARRFPFPRVTHDEEVVEE
jgi:hypothetical protein